MKSERNGRAVMRGSLGALALGLLVGMGGCYNPLLDAEPFWCGAGGKCPDGYECLGGLCRDETLPTPECMNPANPEFAGWPSDADLEPNNHPSLAVTLPCGDSPRDPAYSCPNRENYLNGFVNLTICPPKDNDIYKIYLLPGESVLFTVIYEYVQGSMRDIDAVVKYYNAALPGCQSGPEPACLNDVAVSTSTNHNEELLVSNVQQEGWYYLYIYGKTSEDVNQYAINFTLNPPSP